MKMISPVNPKPSHPRMSSAQAKAEAKAIELLTKAQELLLEGDENVDEAKRIRNEVTDHILPPRRMYIVGKHPRSLLLDVDRRIHHAKFRLTREETDSKLYETVFEPYDSTKIKLPKRTNHFDYVMSKVSAYEKERRSRYGSKNNQLRIQMMVSMGLLLLLGIGLVGLLFYLSTTQEGGELYQSFNWLRTIRR
jgi:hypothetical protein